MSETHPHLAMQFDDPAQQRLSATLGMWTFLATEVLFFGGMFAGYVVYRSRYPEIWGEASRELNLLLGTTNTAVLLASSFTMALAVDAAHKGRQKALQRFLAATIVLAVVFLGIKGYEYGHKWFESLVPGRRFRWPGDPASAGPGQLFFSYYFAMTGCHALHMLVGIGVLSVLHWRAGQGRFTAEYYNPVENAGLYWHFVDIVWVFLFPLLYLINRSS